MDFKLLAGSTLGGGGVGDAAQAASLGIDTGCFPSLTMKQRIRGFVLCFGLGMLTSLLSSIYLTFANYTSFAVLYTFGNVLSMSSTALLFGPKRQVTNMFAKKRVLATIAYIVSLAATLVVAFTVSARRSHFDCISYHDAAPAYAKQGHANLQHGD